MPKRRLNIQTFAGLAAPALDDEDVPLEGASFASGLDPTERPGRLRGFPDDESTGLGQAVKAYAMLDGGDTIIFWDGDEVRKITGASSGIGSSSSIVGAVAASDPQMTSDGERVYMSRGKGNTPKWIGKYQRLHIHDGTGSPPSGFQIEDAIVQKPEGCNLNVLAEGNSGSRSRRTRKSEEEKDGNIEQGSSTAFAFSWTYDGFQEGPLRNTGIVFEGGGEDSVDMRIDWTSRGSFNTPKRVTHINLYAIPNPANTDAPLETGTPRLLERIPVDDEAWSQSSDYDLKSLSSWEVTSGRTRYWWEIGGPRRASTQPLDYDYTLSLDVDAFTSQDLSSVEVQGYLKAKKDAGSALAEVEVRVVDSNGNTIDSENQQVQRTSGDSNGTTDTNYTITLSNYTASNAAAIEVYLNGETGTADDFVFNEVQSIVPTLSSGSVGTTYSKEFKWTGGKSETYRNRTGLAPTADQPPINYSVTAAHGNRHFVTGAQVEGDDYGSYIFRSKALRFSQFPWAQDYVNLETEVHTLVSFNNRLWGFSKSAAYRIDPNTLTVEREYEGKGALARAAVTRSPLGLFWASKDNLYLHDGRAIRDVGDPIQAGEFQEVWGNLQAGADHPAMTWYDPTNDALVVAFDNSATGQNEMWMFHLPDQQWADAIPGPRWMHLVSPSATGTLARSFVGSDGVSYFSMGGALYSFATGSKRPWEWVSKKITADTPSAVKVFYHADVKGDQVTVEYKEDEEASWNTASLDTSANGRHRFVVNSYGGTPPWEGVYNFRLRLDGASGDEVASVSLLTRLRSNTE